VIKFVELAGLLAFPHFELPSHHALHDSGFFAQNFCPNKGRDHSYGDSTGIAPDFPFNLRVCTPFETSSATKVTGPPVF
jgi:hypothetical protein